MGYWFIDSTTGNKTALARSAERNTVSVALM
jgi:hypothetical protein